MFYFVAVAILVAISVALMFAEFNFGLGVLSFVGVLSEIVRQLFFYVVTGEFLSAQYKENLRKLLKPLAAIAAVGILTVVGAKAMEMVSESRCSSNLGEFALYEDGNCGCIYGYELHDNVCISNDEACEKELGKYSIYDGGICRCLTNYSELNGVCVFTNDICTQQFGDNAHAVPGLDKCACDDGYVWNENRDKCIKFVPPPLTEKEKCEKQGYKAQFNVMSNTCECTFSYVKIDGICQTAPYCGENAHYEEGKKCVCDPGFKSEGSECVDPGCSVNSTYDAEDDKCYCKDGYLARNGLHTFGSVRRSPCAIHG
ncbi:hypothetical protein AUJ46_00230 [Candidatus Peregrinibacteria bacterium CG1_02_54_53]|nr:MAG: hypothetical protein AUJ46_00230 [Candidatus Peregrinibacteria bacterium CG1_02_54_53]